MLDEWKTASQKKNIPAFESSAIINWVLEKSAHFKE